MSWLDKRQVAFKGLAQHAWLAKVYGKLDKQEIVVCEEFIRLNDELDHLEFESLVNRMFLNMEAKPKHFKEIMELLTCANTIAVGL